MSLLSIPIFKINKIIEKNKIEQIFVFFGNNLDIEGEDPNELFSREPNNKIFLTIFEPFFQPTVSKKIRKMVAWCQSSGGWCAAPEPPGSEA